MNGTKLSQKIQKKIANKPAVTISSSIDYNIEDDVRVAGIDKFLIKPLFPSMVADMINECMGIERDEAREKAYSQ